MRHDLREGGFCAKSPLSRSPRKAAKKESHLWEETFASKVPSHTHPKTG